ncbi:MAG: hypothetical protein II837_01495 [Treponema sp.]|nr:hypothetical protein [Treponema sp.]MBQ6568098.1 hypothetical protein [Treponema sp.]MBQ7166645.1 hypothetical protein [Treponema sp.]
MSDVMTANLTAMADSMTYDEVLAAISLLLERLKKPFTKEEKGKSSKEEALNAIFARADALHLNSNGEKWTREELYER